MPSLPSTPWTDIDSARVAVDAPVSTDLMTDIVVDLNYLYNNQQVQRFAIFQTAGSNSFEVPVGISNIVLEGCAAGGNGGGGASGGGGGYFKGSFAVTPGETISITIPPLTTTVNADGGDLIVSGSFGTITCGGGLSAHLSTTGGAGGAGPGNTPSILSIVGGAGGNADGGTSTSSGGSTPLTALGGQNESGAIKQYRGFGFGGSTNNPTGGQGALMIYY